MQTGWQKINGIWYYFDNSGAMYSDTVKKINGKLYYFDGSGALRQGQWINRGGGIWNYAYMDGHLAVNETVEGYTLDSNGEWKNKNVPDRFIMMYNPVTGMYYPAYY